MAGPTAVGKTALAIRLAREIRAEIISVDSVQVYRGLDIGSAKPTSRERMLVPHHLIDVVEPDEPFDAADFARLSRRIIRRIILNGRAVILVGGAGLYFNALFNGFSPAPGANPGLRVQLKEMASVFGQDILYDFLVKVDRSSAEKIHPHDTFRLIRAIEIFSATGIPRFLWRKEQKRLEGYPILKVGLIRSRKELYQRIDRRVDEMMEAGFLDEVKKLLDKGYSPALKPLKTLGYRHIISCLRGELSMEESIRQLKRDTRRYAKRQLTWFKADPLIKWFNPDELFKKEKIWPWIVGKRAQR
jgi:tRNA dimethylallyltransferase